LTCTYCPPASVVPAKPKTQVMIDANAMSLVRTLAHERDLPMTDSGCRP
jgi:hypothetical protein